MSATDFSSDPDTMEQVNDRDRWIQKYAVRILIRFRKWHTPIDAANTCLVRLKQDLATLYDDPVKRLLVEATY